MDTQTLIERSAEGDWQSFAELVRQHQSLAFGCAFAILGDFHLAEDATQEAFVAVYLQLHTLRSADAFPWWLRGIVRHQCSRILRTQRVALVTLDHVAEVSTEAQSLDEYVIAQTATADVVAAINTLPLAEREVLALFYGRDSSRRQIAEFLGVPITTVNNRLHSARTHLKRRMLPMAKEAFASHALPANFVARVGKLLEIRGPVVEMEFVQDQRPPLLALVRLADDSGNVANALVAQHLDNGRVRGVMTAGHHHLDPGMSVTHTGAWADLPLDEATLSAALDLIGTRAATSRPEIIETGIKSIDLLAPYQKDGKVAILGQMGVGKMVVIQEIIHNLRGRDADLSLFTFLKPGAELELVQGSIEEATKLSLSMAQMVTLTATNPRDLGPLAATFDAITCMSLSRAASQLWPAVDALRSSSRLLDPAVVGHEHYEVAKGVRALLSQYEALNERIRSEQIYQLAPEDRQVLVRARRIERFLTQYFFVAEEFTKRPGTYVSMADTVRGCAAILRGECDDLPEAAFMYSGTIDDVREKARQTLDSAPA